MLNESKSQQRVGWGFIAFSLVCIVAVVIVMKGYERWSSLHSYPNYLYLGSSDLTQHEISVYEGDKPSIVFLGSSAVAGSNVPVSTSVSNYLEKLHPEYKVFNLGVHQANILDAMAYYILALNYQKPKLVVMGVSPEFFPNHWPATHAISSNLELLSPYLKPNELSELRQAGRKKLFFIEEWLKGKSVSIPSPLLLSYRSFLWGLRRQFFGPVMAANLVGKGVSTSNIQQDTLTFHFLKVFKTLVEGNGGQLVVFLESQLDVDKIYGKAEFSRYKSIISEQLETSGLRYFDYVSKLPNDAAHFIDFIHLTPEAYDSLAKKLSIDLSDSGYL